MSAFSITARTEGVVISCPAVVDAGACQDLLEHVKQWVQAPEALYILDFSQVKVVDAIAHRALMLIHRALKNVGSDLVSIGMQSAIKEQFSTAGMDAVLSPKNSIEEAGAVAKTLTATDGLDMSFVQPFINAVKSTLQIQAGTRVDLGEQYFKKADEEFEVDIAGVISLASRKYNGSLALCFPAKVFLEIYSNMLGEQHEVITKEMEDAAGELLNMIFGVAKAELNDKGEADIQRAIPAIIRGDKLRVHHLSRGSVLVVPCSTSTGQFRFEISLEPV